MQINIQILPAVGASHGHWEVIDFCDFLYLHAPLLRFYLHSSHQFPPLHILNEELLSGGRDQGMSGGCLWRAFEITPKEYSEIKEEMITNPKYSLAYDEELAKEKNMKQWTKAILRKYNPRKKEKK